jgi:hypothetical protein
MSLTRKLSVLWLARAGSWVLVHRSPCAALAPRLDRPLVGRAAAGGCGVVGAASGWTCSWATTAGDWSSATAAGVVNSVSVNTAALSPVDAVAVTRFPAAGTTSCA